MSIFYAMNEIQNRLKILQGKSSQAEFSAKIDITQTRWGRFIRGESQPDAEVLQRICTVLGIAPRWLLFGEGPMYDEDKVHLVHATVGGGPNALRCGQPSSTIELRPEYKQALERNAALESLANEAARGMPSCARCEELLDRLLTAHERLSATHERLSATHDRLDQVQEQAKALLKENGDLKAEIGELREELAVFKKVSAEKEMEEGIPRSA